MQVNIITQLVEEHLAITMVTMVQQQPIPQLLTNSMGNNHSHNSRLVTNNQQVMLDMMPVLILSQHNQQRPQLQDTPRRHHMDRPLIKLVMV